MAPCIVSLRRLASLLVAAVGLAAARAADTIRDLERIVGKHKFGPYLQDTAQWFKIRNRKYSQWAGRENFFERERAVDPDIFLWDSCVFACENV